MARGGLAHLLAALLLLLLLAVAASAAAAGEAEADLAHGVSEAAAFNADADADADGQQHLLPRPLVIELPSARAGDEPAAAAADAEAEADLTPAQGGVPETAADADADTQQLLPRPLVIELPSERAADTEADAVPTDVRCASWRLAAEANNLAPWKAVPAECLPHVRDYVTGPAYRSDLDLVARESAAYARAIAPLTADGRGAWVFDVDETLLSNLPYYAEHGYGSELFDHHKFDEWVERGEAAAIPSSFKLFNEVRELGFKTFLLTGRSEAHRGVTVENLNKQGFYGKSSYSGQQLTAIKPQYSTNQKRGRR